MADESRKEPGQESAESLIDELIRDILADAGQSARATRGPLAALMEAVTASPQRGTARASMLERLLLAQTIASSLADALAPALAETLTPEIMNALEHHAAAESSSRTGEPAAKTGEGVRKSPAR